MTKRPDSHRLAGRPGDDEVAELFRIAGTPPELPAERVAPIREAAALLWRRQVARRRARRAAAWASGALAATVILAVAVLRPGAQTAPSPVVATLSHSSGPLTIHAGQGGETGQDLTAGAMVTTGHSGLAAFALGPNVSLRLDGQSRVRFESAGALTLEQGALYVDSAAEDGQPLEIRTLHGTVTDVGTQFEVRLVPSEHAETSLRVRVREGQVRVDGPGGARSAEAGQQLTVGSRGFEAGLVASDDRGWEWAAEAAPPLEIEGLQVPAFLDWVARELGLHWSAVGPLDPFELEQIVLHGSIDGLTPVEALDVVLQGAGLGYRREGQRLEVRLASQAGPGAS